MLDELEYDVPKPASVKWAVAISYLCIAIGVIVALINLSSVHKPAESFGAYVIGLFITYKISHQKNWARWVYVIFYSLLFFLLAIVFITNYPAASQGMKEGFKANNNIFLSILSVPGFFAPFLNVILLLTPKSNRWFKSA